MTEGGGGSARRGGRVFPADLGSQPVLGLPSRVGGLRWMVEGSRATLSLSRHLSDCRGQCDRRFRETLIFMFWGAGTSSCRNDMEGFRRLGPDNTRKQRRQNDQRWVLV